MEDKDIVIIAIPGRQVLWEIQLHPTRVIRIVHSPHCLDGYECDTQHVRSTEDEFLKWRMEP